MLLSRVYHPTLTLFVQTFVKNTLLGSKALLRRQAPGVKLFGLWKSRVRRHGQLRALRDEMGEDVALRHAQEGRQILRQNLRTMMGVPGQVSDARLV